MIRRALACIRRLPAAWSVLAPVLAALAVALACTRVVLTVEPRAMDRVTGWAPALAGLGVGVWLYAHLWERATRRTHVMFTAAIGGLALSAAVMHNGKAAYLVAVGDYVRAWNVYHYYLGPKDFDEVGHFDLYRATLRADDEWQAKKRSAPRSLVAKWDRIADYGHIKCTRDMHTYDIVARRTAVADYVPEATFTAQRWRQFGNDTRWLRPYQARNKWKRTLLDLGYNPTPVWTAVLRPVVNLLPPPGPWMRRLAFSSFPGYLVMLLGMWWDFGARAALVAVLWLNVIAFNWDRFVVGVLEYDWLVSMVLGLALYAKGRPAAAGVALSWAVMTRGFPALLVVPIAVRWLHGALARRSVHPRQRDRRRFVAGLAAAGSLLLVSSLTTGRGLGAWTEWVEKIETHSYFHPTNHAKRVGLGRLALHHPTRQNIWAVEPGSVARSLTESHARKRALQVIGTLLLALAVIRRSDEDAMILMVFSVFLFAPTSRYYASDWILLFALGARPRQMSTDGWPPTPTLAVVAGAALLGMAAWFDAVRPDAGRYFLVNYLMFLLLVVLCLAYSAQDVRALWRGRRRPG